jgi:tRNA G18 (ribose-2'-O)-methylase SpoU
MERTPYIATAPAAAYDLIEKLPVAVLLDNVRSMYNVGSFFRTVDAAGVEELLLGGITAYPPKKAITKTALGAEERVRWRHAWEAMELAGEVRGRGFELAAVETSVGAEDLYDWHPNFPVCLVFGHEVDGIRPELLEMCDRRVRIPMLGLKHSLNVATAGGVVIYELLRQYRRMVERARAL